MGVEGGAVVPMGEQEAPVGLQGAQTQERGGPTPDGRVGLAR